MIKDTVYVWTISIRTTSSAQYFCKTTEDLKYVLRNKRHCSEAMTSCYHFGLNCFHIYLKKHSNDTLSKYG